MAKYNGEYLKRMIFQISKQEKFSEKAKIFFSSASENCDGYLGDIITIDIIEQDRSLHLVAKICINNELIQSFIPIAEACGNELHFYKNVFPTLHAFQSLMKVPKKFNSIPKFYLSGESNEEVFIILENIKKSGFVMHDYKQYLDEQHCAMLCEIFGRFHALSFALQFCQYKVYSKLIEELQCVQSGFMRYKGGLLKQCASVIQKTFTEMGRSNKMIDHYVENVENVMMNILYQSRNDKFSCILHCDGWSNNFMFKYKEGGQTLEDIKLLDWQACYYGSPVLDLSYVLYAGASKHILENLQEYLKIYHDSLCDFFQHTDIRMHEIYPFEVLKQQWKKYCEFGIIRGIIIAKLRTSKIQDESDEPEENKIPIFEKMIVTKCDGEQLYQRVNELYEHLESIGVF